MIQQADFSKNQKQWEHTHLDGYHHSDQKVTCQKILSLEIIPGDSICCHGREKDAACSTAKRQDKAIEKIKQKPVILDNIFVIIQDKCFWKTDEVGDQISFSLEGIKKRRHDHEDCDTSV